MLRYMKNKNKPMLTSLTWPDPFRATAYRLEIISAPLQGSGVVHVSKKNQNHQLLVSVNWLTPSLT